MNPKTGDMRRIKDTNWLVHVFSAKLPVLRLNKVIPLTKYDWYIVAIGVFASLPLLVFGFPHWTHDGFCHLRWWQNFSAQFWAGNLYPRWLPEVNHGFGSATFFYYPPLPYWASAWFAPLAGYALPAWRALGWASALALVLSGLSAQGCLRKLVSEPRAFMGAVLYMLMPYHLAIDLLERGAYAEYWSFVWMPLVIRGILGLRGGERHAFLKTAFACAGLFLTHLPTAVTFTPIAIGYALCLGARVLLRTLAALVVAGGLAGAYLVPALTTQAAVSTEYLRFPYETTFFFLTLDFTVPVFRPDGFNLRLLAIFLGSVFAVGCCYVLVFLQKRDAPLLRQRLVWLGLGVGVLLMMLPVSLWLYQLFSPLRMIQFAWRFLAPASFLGAVLIAVFWPEPGDAQLARILHGLVLIVMGILIVSLTWRAYRATCLGPHVRWGLAPAFVDPTDNDVAEYRPANAQLEAALCGLGNDQVKVVQGSARVTILEWKARWIRIQVEAATDAAVLLRQFYYPGWSATTAGGIRLTVEPDKDTGAVRLGVPSGSHRVTLRLERAFPEQIGNWITLATCIGCLLNGLMDRNGRVALCQPGREAVSTPLRQQ